MDIFTFNGGIILIAEWDFERKVQIRVIINQDAVYVYINGRLASYYPANQFFNTLLKG